MSQSQTTTSQPITGKHILDVLNSFHEPVTLDQLVKHVAKTQKKKPEEVKEMVEDALKGGVRYGYVQRTNNYYYCLNDAMDALANYSEDDEEIESPDASGTSIESKESNPRPTKKKPQPILSQKASKALKASKATKQTRKITKSDNKKDTTTKKNPQLPHYESEHENDKGDEEKDNEDNDNTNKPNDIGKQVENEDMQEEEYASDSDEDDDRAGDVCSSDCSACRETNRSKQRRRRRQNSDLELNDNEVRRDRSRSSQRRR